MKRTLQTATIAIAFSATSSSGQTAPGNSDYSYCLDRPEEPEVIQSISIKEAHKRILAQRLYLASALRTVAETGECSCANLFPPWDFAVEEYLTRYSNVDDRWTILEATSEYRRIAAETRKEIRGICVEQGNW